jgi:DNA-binding PadR family transcriptional regulator
VLGIVFKRAPCTAYAIMQEFATSSSSYFRGSAGAIYPLVKRLEDRGLLRGADGARGRRARRAYSLSREGRTALRRWLAPPLPESDAAFAVDPVRTRTYFLAALTKKQRLEFARDAEHRLRAQLATVSAECERYRRRGDPFSSLAVRGALHVMRARLRWIVEVRKALADLD